MTKNPEIGKRPLSELFPISSDWGKYANTNFVMNVSSEYLVNFSTNSLYEKLSVMSYMKKNHKE